MRIDITETQPGQTEVKILMIGYRGFWACVRANFEDQRGQYRQMIRQGQQKLKAHLEAIPAKKTP